MEKIYINLKEYEYCIPDKLKDLKKDLISISELLKVVEEYDDEVEHLQEELKKAKAVEESDDSEYIEDWLESRSK